MFALVLIPMLVRRIGAVLPASLNRFVQFMDGVDEAWDLDDPLLTGDY